MLRSSDEEFDIAIIGAGVAGCYLAFRLMTLDDSNSLHRLSPLLPLLKKRNKLRVGLFECSSRIGGRLWSVGLPGCQGTAEFGGMRFHERMQTVLDVMTHLNLEPQIEEFYTSGASNLVYTRGRRLYHDELNIVGRGGEMHSLYNMHPRERGRTAAGLAAFAIDCTVPGFSDLRGRYHRAFREKRWDEMRALGDEYEQRKLAATINGCRLHELSWQTLLSMVLSQEAIHFIQDVDGYESLASNGNAAGWLDIIYYTPADAHYKRLACGFEAVPQALLKRFEDAGGHVRLLHRLVKFDKVEGSSSSPVYQLIFHSDDGGAPTSTTAGCRQKGDSILTRAKIIILALPKRAIQLLDQDNCFFRNPKLQAALGSVSGIAAIKLYLQYPYPWWEAIAGNKGRSTTDLPLRQVYYPCLQNNGRPRSLKQSTFPAAVLAAYANGPDVEYWKSLEHGALYEGKREPEETSQAGEKTRVQHSVIPPVATCQMVKQAHAFMMELHGVREAPMPNAGFYQDWSNDPYGGGWHVWKERSQSGSLIPYMRHPIDGEQIFIANECWSNEIGSVEGALNTSECLLQDHFGFPWPDWLDQNAVRLGPRRNFSATSNGGRCAL